jgi:hypothetical protein
MLRIWTILYMYYRPVAAPVFFLAGMALVGAYILTF